MTTPLDVNAQEGVTAPGAPPPDLSTPSTGSSSSGAFAQIKSMLDQAGLGELAQWAWGRYQAGASLDQIGMELYDQPAFKRIYPEYGILAGKGRAVSVAELQAYRKAVVGIFRANGIPSGFYDSNEALSKFAADEVSVAEISQRVADASKLMYQTSPSARAELERMYGVTPGDLTAFFLDDKTALPLLEQRFTAAQIGGASKDSGYGLLSPDEAARLAAQGVDAGQALAGFNDLASSRELFGALNGGETDISRDVQLGAEFDRNAQDQQVIDQRRKQRLATFAGGGDFATTNQGIVGVA